MPKEVKVIAEPARREEIDLHRLAWLLIEQARAELKAEAECKPRSTELEEAS